MSAPRQIHDADGAMIGDCESASIGDVLPDLFEASVDRHRARVAIECAGESLTCADLDAAANRWATWLRQRGVRRGMRVAFWLPRSIEVHPVLLGVLKSGAAYVPLDPEYLRDRVQFILENSGAAALVTTEPLVAGLSGLSDGVSLHVVERVRDDVAAQLETRLTRDETGLTADDEAYVIYTSGSTGRPKGVRISHRNVVHLVRVEGEMFQVSEMDRVFQGFSLAFDASVEEVWLADHSGGTLMVGTSEMIRSGPELIEAVGGGWDLDSVLRADNVIDDGERRADRATAHRRRRGVSRSFDSAMGERFAADVQHLWPYRSDRDRDLDRVSSRSTGDDRPRAAGVQYRDRR